MKTILVDDMLLDLQLFEMKCADMPDFEIVGKFTSSRQALAYAEENRVDFALLDIDMPGMNGIVLAQELRKLHGDVIVVFVTAHPRFAVDALRMKADYIIFKPYDKEDIADVLERAKLLQRRQGKRVRFHTFGAFEMLVDGQYVHFTSHKAKELLALCVFREGRPVTTQDMVNALWGEDAADSTESIGYRRVIKELADTLRKYGLEELLVRKRGSVQICMNLCESDYQDFLDGRPEALSMFQGSFMEQYSWAESAIYGLEERKALLLQGGRKTT